MRIIHFANDTPFAEHADGFSVDASALGIEDGSPTPDQIAVNGYSFSFFLSTPRYLVYQRDHDHRNLTIYLK